MLSPINGSTERYLDDLGRIQSALDKVQREVTSGLRVTQPSDDPAVVPQIMGTLAAIAASNQAQSNYSQVKTELDAGDGALQSAIRAVERAITLGSQAASSLPAGAQSTVVSELQSLQSDMVNASSTSLHGRFIFSGDLDQGPQYVLDSSQPNGVRQLFQTTSTRALLDSGGSTIWVPKTAQDIFDARDAGGAPVAGNVFAAIAGLLTAVQNNDPGAAAAAVSSLKAADDHLNQQLGLYGIAENRVADATESASKSVVSSKQELSTLRDADIASDAIALNQLQLQQQAALSARAKTSQLSLFQFLA